HAVQVLRMGENAPTTERDARATSSPTHNNLIAKVIAATVIAKLTHGPHRITPAMIAIAKRGANDLPNTTPVCDKNACRRWPRVCPFPLIFTVQRIESRQKLPARQGRNLDSAPQIQFAGNYTLWRSSA